MRLKEAMKEAAGRVLTAVKESFNSELPVKQKEALELLREIQSAFEGVSPDASLNKMYGAWTRDQALSGLKTCIRDVEFGSMGIMEPELLVKRWRDIWENFQEADEKNSFENPSAGLNDFALDPLPYS